MFEASASSRTHRYLGPKRPLRRMTRCECAGLDFADIGAALSRDGCPEDEIPGQMGCGQICTACLPDLRSYLAERAQKRVTG